MHRISFAILLAFTGTAYAAQVPPPVLVEGRSADASAAGQTTTAHGVQALDDATAAAVIGALQTKFEGNVQFKPGEVTSERASLRGIELHGSGQVRLEGTQSWLPIHFVALYDTDTRTVGSPSITLGEPHVAKAARARKPSKVIAQTAVAAR